MADAATFEIAIEANGIGVDTATADMQAFADRIRGVNAVATQFDHVASAMRARMEATASAAKLAADALGIAEKRYGELESAANKAAKEVEKAALAGKDTSALGAAAAVAAAKMREQAAVVDDLRAKSLAASSAQAKLAESIKLVEDRGKKQTEAYKKMADAQKAVRSGNYAEAERLNARRMENSAKASEKWSGRLATLRAATLAAGAAFLVGAVGAVAFAVAQDPEAMERLGSAAERAKKGFTALFKGLKLGPFVAGLEDIMGLLDEGTSSSKGLKLLFETLLQPILDGAAKVAPFVKEMFKGMIFGVLSVVLAILTLRNNLLKMIPQETRDAIKAFAAEHFTLETAFKAGAALIVLATIALAGFAVAAIAAAAPILLIVAAIALVVAAFVYWETILASISKAWFDLDKTLRDAVKNIITGIVDGIKNGAGAVWQAMKDMATGALNAFKGALGIKSPSVAFAMQGTMTTAGYIEGIEAGTPKVESALESMVEPADFTTPAPAGKAGGAGATPSSGGNVVHIASLTIGDSPVAQQSWADFKRAVDEVLEGAVISIGGVEAPAT